MATIALVSCVKTKLPHAAPAESLYKSALFRAMRRYAQTKADHWYVLSAEYGLLSPDAVIEPYEKTLLALKKGDREEWAKKVSAQLEAVLPPGCRVVLLAGQRYREYLEPLLRSRGHRVDVPLRGMRLGEQLRALEQEGQT